MGGDCILNKAVARMMEDTMLRTTLRGDEVDISEDAMVAARREAASWDLSVDPIDDWLPEIIAAMARSGCEFRLASSGRPQS